MIPHCEGFTRRHPSDILLTMLVDEFLPVYDVSDAVATVVEADVGTTWDGLMQVDLDRGWPNAAHDWLVGCASRLARSR